MNANLVSTRTTTRPAILGGPAAVAADQRVANRWPLLTEEDERAVLEVLRDGDISTHPVVRALEDDYRKAVGSRHALAHCNGTAALLAAFFALELEPGDEVLVPSATFWASVLPMLWVGAVPVFCESEPERFGIDPVDAASKVTSRTRAIVVVHLWGMPSRMTELGELARRHGLAVIEDASHALGATWNGRPCGTLGDVSVFSLQGSKLAPAGEGGIFLTDHDRYYEQAQLLGDITRIRDLESPGRRFAATSFGIKTRMAPLSAAVARAQLARFPERVERRSANIRYLARRLEPLGFDTGLPPAHVERVYFENLIRPRPERTRELSLDTLATALRAEGCDVTAPRYPLLHQQPFFTEGQWRRVARLDDRVPVPVYRADALPKTAAVQSSLLRLPCFPNADRALLDQYADAFEKVCAHSGEIRAAAASRA